MIKIPRRRFVGLLGAGAAGALALPLPGASQDGLRGDRVGWARLKTPSPEWKRHAGSDPVLTKFFRDETTLNIDPNWYVADVNHLAELCKYPFLFSQGVGMVVNPTGRSTGVG